MEAEPGLHDRCSFGNELDVKFLLTRFWTGRSFIRDLVFRRKTYHGEGLSRQKVGLRYVSEP